MKCPKCSKDYDDSFAFCPFCAEPKPDLTQATPPAPPPAEEVVQQEAPPEEEAAVPTEVAAIAEKKPPRFSKKTKGVVAVVIVLLVIGLAVGLTLGLGGGGSNTTGTTSTSVSTDNSNLTFGNQNWNEVCSNPSRFKGAKVEGLVGKIFVAPEVSGSAVAIQMYADPANSDQPTIVYYSGGAPSQFANSDIIKVDGIVGGEFSGQNAMGGTITDPTIQATSVTKTDASALIQGGKDVTVAQQQNQNGVVIIVDKMVLQDNETDFFVRVNNQSGANANFEGYEAQLQVGNQQLNEDSSKSSQYGEMPSSILPGVVASGVLVFPAVGTPVPSTGAVALHLTASSDNYNLNFNPYVFNISW